MRIAQRGGRSLLLACVVAAVAIAAGGSTLGDHAQATGDPGNFQHHFRVYGRAGQIFRAKGCQGVVRRILAGGRTPFYCPRRHE